MLKPLPLHHSPACRVCGNTDLVCYLDLGVQPPSDRFIDPGQIGAETAYPLTLHLCPDCGLSQLVDHIRFEDMVDEYLYVTSSSKALCRELEALAENLIGEFTPPEGTLICDIGSNDGVLLRAFPPGRYRRLGIDPAAAGKVAAEAGIEQVARFFDPALSSELVAAHGRAGIVAATNVLNYLDDIRSFTQGVAAMLDPGGVFVAEFSYLPDVIRNGWFDTIYHEHLLYLSLTPLARLLGEAGLRIFRAEYNEVGASGSALRIHACHAGAAFADDGSVAKVLQDEADWGIADPERYRDFAGRVAEIRTGLLELIARIRLEGGVIGAFGAPAKGNTLLNYAGLGAGDIVAAADANPAKIGKVTPGSHIPIVNDEAFLAAGITHALLLSWNYADFFLQNAEFIKRGGLFIVPFPTPHIRG